MTLFGNSEHPARWMACLECALRNCFTRPRLRECGDRYMWEYPHFVVTGRPSHWKVVARVG